MHIVMVVYEVYARDARVRRHSRALVQAGHAVTVLAVGGAGAEGAALADGVELMSVVPAKYRGDRKGTYVLAYAMFFARVFSVIFRSTLRRPPDAVYVNNPPDALVFAAWPARVRGAKIILDVHDQTSELYAAKFGQASGLGSRVIELVERISYRFADALVTVADAYRARIQRIVGNDMTVATVWNVPDVDDWLTIGAARLDRSVGEKPLRLGHHGTIVERFGIDRAVDAVDMLHQRGFPVTLDILGDGDFADAVERRIAQGRLQSVVRFDRRSFDHADLIEFTERIDIGIAPYRPSEFIGHSLPTKLLEYCALGIPTIVTETEMIRDYLSDGVRLVRTGSPEELVDAITELADPVRRTMLREAGLGIARRYGWAQQRNNLLGLVAHVQKVGSAT
ncbi:MAG: glycosyltransferase [Chloroflexota bacterium]|nr:glycosyltransferase [Chloroflexota bacterium]